MQKIYSNQAFTLNLPKNYPSRTVFRFYNETDDGNNTALDFESAVFVLLVSDEAPLEFALTKKENLDFVLYIAANFLSLITGVYDCAVYVDDDPVPFAIGQAGVGSFMLPDQAVAILNASRNALKVNNTILENPAFADSDDFEFDIVDDYERQLIQGRVTRKAVYDLMKAILSEGVGIALTTDDNAKTIEISVE